MPIVQSNSGDPPSGITINDHNQQSEPLLSSIRLGELLQERNRKKLALYFFIGFVLGAILAIFVYGLTLGIFELFGLFSSKEQCIKRVIGYHWLYSNLTNSQLSKLTHLVLVEADIDKNGTIYFRYWGKKKMFIEVNERASSLGVKTLISLSAPPKLIEIGAKIELINSIINFTHDNHLDGIEISSEFLCLKEDIQNALEFCKELRQKLRSLNRTDFIINLSVYTTLPGAAIKDLLKCVDFVNLHTDSYYVPHFHSNNGAMGPTQLYGNYIVSKIQHLNQQMKLYSCRSGSPSKLNMMVEFNGNYWKNVTPSKPSSDTLQMSAEIKYVPSEVGAISWKELKKSKFWDISKASWNHESKSPYIWNPENRTYLAFENERSIDEKMKYAMYKNFGGVAIYLLHRDDDEDSLLNTISSKPRCSSEVSDEVNYECD